MAHPIIPYLGDLVKRHVMSGNLAKKAFAKDVGVPYMVVYRLIAGEQIASLDFFNARRLLKCVEPETYLETLQKFYPNETVEFLQGTGEVEDSSEELFDLAVYAFSDPNKYKVFNFATESLGAKREDVAAEFGRVGLEIIDDMVERKAILIREDGTFQSLLSKVNSWDEKLSVQVCENNLQLFSAAVPGSYLRNWAHGFNDEGVKKYYNAHASFVKYLKELEEDPSLRGKRVVFSSVGTGQVHAPKEKSEGNKI